MSFLKNTVSLLALFSVIPAAYAVTARPSVLNGSTARRMPTMTAFITGATGGTVSGDTTSSSLLANAECIDAYTTCIKGGDVCGTGFEECTNKILFHAKMPQCLSTLAQCSSAGVNSLFGTSSVSALNNVASKNTYGEITDYTYPTDGSVLGQLISAAAIENMYDTSSCVRRYSSCLRKESVCGADFELCTTNTEFKKQAVFCDATLARCQSEGKMELFGNATATSSTVPSASSRIGEMIAEGAALAAVNAVSTCYKVVDQCILNACGANPYKCYENATAETVKLVEAINNGEVTAEETSSATEIISKSGISAYIKNSCLDTVGANKYCYATFLGDGQMPTSSQLRDEDNQEEIYDLAYSARMNSGMKAKITELVNKFDTRAKEKCVETIKSCAMRTCGSGSGAACYSQVFGAKDKSINNNYSRNEIRTGCMSIVNTDANCKYAAQNPNATGTYNYSYMQGDAFDVLFPEYDDGAENDPIGVIASLNASLANNYSDAALAQMKKRCQSVATSCVRSMCGNDYVNCYRNRTDIYSSLTNSGDSSFDKSMNKVGGVLDYTIVLGLCVDTVKSSDVCAEHLAIEANKLKINNQGKSSWGTTGSVRSEWIDAGSASHMEMDVETVQAYDENGNKLCSDKCGNQGQCDTASTDVSCGVYETPVTIAYTTYIESQAANTLFKDLIYDLEIEAQAKYNAKLTQQQNMCLSENASGGIMGNRDLGSVFQWVKLKSNKVPTNYSVAGLKPNQFVASNDLYGSFCRVRVTLQSDDKRIQDAISQGADWSTAYFAAGDAFTCGAWIPSDKLEELAKDAGTDAADAKAAEQYSGLKWWTTAIGALGGGVGGGYLGAGIQDGSVFSGLSGKVKPSKKLTAEQCNNAYNSFIISATNTDRVASAQKLVSLVSANDQDGEYTNQVTSVQLAIGNYNQNPNGNTVGSADYNSCSEAVSSAQTNYKSNNYSVANSIIETYMKNGKYRADLSDEYKTFNETSCDNASCNQDKYNKMVNALNDVCARYKNVYVGSAKTESNYNALNNAMVQLKNDCVTLANSSTNTKGRTVAAAISGVVTSVAGGALGYHIVDEIQKQERSQAEQEAIKKFMDEVGSKIHCYIGADEVGRYGDVISTSME